MSPVSDSNKQKNSREIQPLTGLRFVAALYVYLFHFQLRWPLAQRGWLANILAQGAIGMAIFFILSGFVLAYVYDGSHLNTRAYYLNRIGRIYPVYLTAAILTAPWLWVVISQLKSPVPAVLGFLKLSVLLVTNLTMTQAWFPQLFAYWNDSGSWSISTEAFFYALFPVLVVLLAKLSRRQLVIAWCVFYIFSVLPALSFAVFENRPSPGVPIFYAMPVFRLPEFLCGICICMAGGKFKMQLRYPLAAFVLALAVLLGSVAMIQPHLPIYTGYNFIAVPAISVIILALTQGVPFFGALLGSPLFRWLGRISYCFYSFQPLILMPLIERHDYIVQVFPSLSNNLLLGFVSFCLVLALAALGHHLIEEPARRHIRSLPLKRATPQVVEAETIATGP